MTDQHSATQGETAGTAIDITVPHSARIWNYWLGGKDNYAVDRAAGDQYREVFPGIVDVARARGAFSPAPSGTWPRRPESGSSSTSARGCPRRTTPTRSPSGWPRSRIVYVDNDPLVLATPGPC